MGDETMPILHWLTRDEDLKTAARVPYRLLEEVPELGYGDPASENMLIQGDNLEALKALLPLYAGKVKCIYIDPPYNTRSTPFLHYDDNLEHAQWLGAIYPRLELLWMLLAHNGALFVSIDDQEGHYLKVLLDEVFGRKNFTASFIWQKVDSPNDNKVPIAPDHEFVFCYEKVRAQAGFRKLGDETLLDAYPNVGEDGRRYRDRLVKKNGKNSLRSDRPTMWFAITAPDGSEIHPYHDDGREARWALGKAGVKKAIQDGLLIWKERLRGSDKVWVPYKREYAPNEPARPHPTILLDVKTSRQAKAHQTDLLPLEKQFDTVKPEQLIDRLLDIATRPGDLVLDAYIGTGTTVAVAEKKQRKWIGIEQGEQVSTHCLPRLRAVIDGEQGGISKAVNWQGGGGFRFYRLGQPVFDASGRLNHGIRFEHLAAHLWFVETRRALGRPKRSPLLGVHQGTAYFLLYNGVLGDKRPQGGNVLTRKVLDELEALLAEHLEGGTVSARVIYGESARILPATLKASESSLSKRRMT